MINFSAGGGSKIEFDGCRQFIEQLARMSTPTDPDKIKEYRDGAESAHIDASTDEEVAEDIISDLPGDDAYSDALVFYDMIRKARELVKAAP